MTVALLLPLTRGLDVTTALIMFAGIYYGGMYGGSTTSILLNTPGRAPRWSPPSRATRWPGPGERRRRWPAAIGSFVAGTIATLALALLAPTVADLAVEISRPTGSPSWCWPSSR